MQDRSEVQERGSGTARQRANQCIFSGIPDSAGPRLTTSRGGAVHSLRPPGSQIFKSPQHFVAVMLAPAPGMSASLGCDEVQEFDAGVGMIMIIPANVESRATWSCTVENAVVALPPESLLELAIHEFDTSNIELQPPPFGTIDAHGLQLAQLLKAELTQREAPNEFYVDSLVTMFGVHILRNYAAERTWAASPKGGLSNRSAQRVREFLAVNFSRKMSVAELAAISCCSPRHFIHAFTKTFGEPPHKHILGLRLSFAERLLAKGDLSIAEVAHLSGFGSQSHLTTTMVKHRGMTPMQVRRRR